MEYGQMESLQQQMMMGGGGGGLCLANYGDRVVFAATPESGVFSAPQSMATSLPPTPTDFRGQAPTPPYFDLPAVRANVTHSGGGAEFGLTAVKGPPPSRCGNGPLFVPQHYAAAAAAAAHASLTPPVQLANPGMMQQLVLMPPTYSMAPGCYWNQQAAPHNPTFPIGIWNQSDQSNGMQPMRTQNLGIDVWQPPRPRMPPRQTRQPQRRGARAGGRSLCVYCRQRGESQSYYETHELRDEEGRVSCPMLRAHVCRRCGATGDVAHVESYCQRSQPPTPTSPTLADFMPRAF